MQDNSATYSTKTMNPIDKVLKWCQLLQASCFGTEICLSIEASKGVVCDKMMQIFISTPNHTTRHLITSDMPTEEIFQAWGSIKQSVSELRKKYGYNEINKHWREKE